MEIRIWSLSCDGLNQGSFHQGFERLVFWKLKNVLDHMEDSLKNANDYNFFVS
jgi:hypothetical protein